MWVPSPGKPLNSLYEPPRPLFGQPLQVLRDGKSYEFASELAPYVSDEIGNIKSLHETMWDFFDACDSALKWRISTKLDPDLNRSFRRLKAAISGVHLGNQDIEGQDDGRNEGLKKEDNWVAENALEDEDESEFNITDDENVSQGVSYIENSEEGYIDGKYCGQFIGE
ncbi:hypothetical protein TWF694_005465 [Orbilia ellipsospora]|uniref:Uncharacterized protein n=1 Tax=Orbilia ellipsospora TaxID=2528407 RepID=A0AAV9WT62_9PEZI